MIKKITNDNVPLVLYSHKLDYQSILNRYSEKETHELQLLSDIGISPRIKYQIENKETDFPFPVSYFRIVVIGFDTKGSKYAAWERSILVSGLDQVKVLGVPVENLTSKESLNLQCLFVVSQDEFQVVVTGIDKTEVKWVANIEKII